MLLRCLHLRLRLLMLRPGRVWPLPQGDCDHISRGRQRGGPGWDVYIWGVQLLVGCLKHVFSMVQDLVHAIAAGIDGSVRTYMLPLLHSAGTNLSVLPPLLLLIMPSRL